MQEAGLASRTGSWQLTSLTTHTEQREKTGSVARVLISKPSPGDILPPRKVPVTEDQMFKY